MTPVATLRDYDTKLQCLYLSDEELTDMEKEELDTTALVRQIDACKQYILEQRKLRLTRKAVARLRKDARSKANP